MTKITPAPTGSLAVEIECTAKPTDNLGTSHTITINADWSVSAPEHDLGADRVSRALGGWSSCLHFAESTVPAYRHVLGVMHRPASLVSDARGRWLNTMSSGCRHTPHVHTSLRDAVRHEVSYDHAAGLHRNDLWRVDGVEIASWSHLFQLLWVARGAWVQTARPYFVRLGVNGYLQLWRNGLLPGQAETIAQGTPTVAFPLPVDYFINAHYRQLESERRAGRGTR